MKWFVTDAFSASLYSVWSDTPFVGNMDELAFARAHACFADSTRTGEHQRRTLLRSYMRPKFASDEATDTLARFNPVLCTDNSVVQRVIRNLCTVYTEQPALIDAELWMHDVVAASGFWNAMMRIHRMAKLCGTVLVRPLVIHGVLQFYIYTPDQYQCHRSVEGNITEVWIHQGFANNSPLFQRWMPDSWSVINGLQSSGEVQQTNPYGQLPFCEISFNQGGLVGGMWELCRTQLELNELDVLEKESLLYNSFGVWLFTNLGLDSRGSLKLSPARVFIRENVRNMPDAPVPPKIEHITAEGAYLQLAEYRKQKVRAIFRNCGLPTSLTEDSLSVVSGAALTAERFELDEIRRDDVSILRPIERQLFKLLCLVSNCDAGTSYPTDVEPISDYAEMRAYADPRAEFETEMLRFTTGAITASQFLKRVTDADELSEQDAQTTILKNRQFIQSIGANNEANKNNN